jgi:hypothetical protein
VDRALGPGAGSVPQGKRPFPGSWIVGGSMSERNPIEASPAGPVSSRVIPRKNRPDWRGWIALAWVLWWAWAYGRMAIQARAPQVLAWIRSLTTGS